MPNAQRALYSKRAVVGCSALAILASASFVVQQALKGETPPVQAQAERNATPIAHAARPALQPEVNLIRIGGTGGGVELMRELGSRYATRTAARFEIVPGLGTTGGLGALADGVLEMAVAGRPLRDAEIAKGLRVAYTFTTPYVFASSHPRPDPLEVRDLERIFRSARPTWRDGVPVNVVLRPKSDSDSSLLSALFPSLTDAIADARLRPDLPVAATDQDNADAGERLPGSLIGTGYVQVVLEKRNLRLITIGNAMPSLEAMISGTYPYRKPLYIVTRAGGSAPIEAFLAWLQSDASQHQLSELHVVGRR